MIDEDRTMQLFGYTSNKWKSGSQKPIVAVCEECGKYRIIRKQDYRDLCYQCGIKKLYIISKPKFVSEQDRFIKGTGIDRILTIEKYGYDPIDLSIKSHKKVYTKCYNCNKYRIIHKSYYRNLCISCSGIQGKKLPKPQFVKKSTRFILNTGIDRILTIEKFGYDPIDLKPKSHRLIWTICQNCGEGRKIEFCQYRNLCSLCTYKYGEDSPHWKGGWNRNHVLPESQCLKLNDRFLNSDAHHLTKSIIIYIPSDLHNYIWHNLKSGLNMSEINLLALQFINGEL